LLPAGGQIGGIAENIDDEPIDWLSWTVMTSGNVFQQMQELCDRDRRR
jgi:hypothetical protein